MTPTTTTAKTTATTTNAISDGLGSNLGSKLAYLTRALKTPTIGRVWEDLAAQARDANWSHEEYLTAVLERQVADTSRSTPTPPTCSSSSSPPATSRLGDGHLEPAVRTLGRGLRRRGRRRRHDRPDR